MSQGRLARWPLMNSSGNQTAPKPLNMAVSAARVWTRRNPCWRTARSTSIGRRCVARREGGPVEILDARGHATGGHWRSPVRGARRLLVMASDRFGGRVVDV